MTLRTRLTRLAKPVLRPFARPVMARVDRRIDPVREDVDALTRHLPILLDTIASQNAAARESRRELLRLESERSRLEGEIWSLRERVEFTRKELMFEMRYGARGPGGRDTPEVVEPRIVAPDGIPKDDVRLNLGCGHLPLAGFVNVDVRELEDVDVVADVHKLPFPVDSLARIHSAHLLEHFSVEELQRALLPYWVSLLRPGGLFTAIVPDAETMIAEFSAGRLSFEDLRLVTFGQQEYDGDFHFNMFSRDSIRELLEGAGLSDVRVVESGRRNGVCYEMELEGRRPATAAAVPQVVDASAAGR